MSWRQADSLNPDLERFPYTASSGSFQTLLVQCSFDAGTSGISRLALRTAQSSVRMIDQRIRGQLQGLWG